VREGERERERERVRGGPVRAFINLLYKVLLF